MTHSIYTEKEVFLRELISNASDSLEKQRYQRALDSSGASDKLEISIETDPKEKLLIIKDNGTGMSKEDMISNLGTIARSGSKAFVEALKSKGKAGDGEGIIGQFGVGFYSVEDTFH